MAEAGGFSTVWIGEHHAMEYTDLAQPDAAARLPGRPDLEIRLGAGTIIAPFWNPIRVAGECALLDVISNGRMEVGLARGAYQFEFDRMAGGIPATSGGTHLRELVPAVRELWQGDYAHDGEIWQFPTSTSVPKPVQQPMPPMWIAARDPDSHDFAVKSGCNVMVTPLMKGDEEVVDLEEQVRDRRSANHPEHTATRADGAAPHPRPRGRRPGGMAARRQGDRHASTAPSTPGSATRPRPVDGFLEPSPESKFAGRPEFEPESLHKTAMIGTPEEVIDRLRPYQEIGVDEFSFWCDNSLSARGEEEVAGALHQGSRTRLPVTRGNGGRRTGHRGPGSEHARCAAQMWTSEYWMWRIANPVAKAHPASGARGQPRSVTDQASAAGDDPNV